MFEILLGKHQIVLALMIQSFDFFVVYILKQISFILSNKCKACLVQDLNYKSLNIMSVYA